MLVSLTFQSIIYQYQFTKKNVKEKEMEVGLAVGFGRVKGSWHGPAEVIQGAEGGGVALLSQWEFIPWETAMGWKS